MILSLLQLPGFVCLFAFWHRKGSCFNFLSPTEMNVLLLKPALLSVSSFSVFTPQVSDSVFHIQFNQRRNTMKMALLTSYVIKNKRSHPLVQPLYCPHFYQERKLLFFSLDLRVFWPNLTSSLHFLNRNFMHIKGMTNLTR